MINQVRLSVCLAVYNEEANLGACLESVKEIAEEIVIVDGGSSDATVKIAKKYAANVISTDNPAIFHINKQKALEACRGVWILQLDADERVSEALAKEIMQVVRLSDAQLARYVVQDAQKRALLTRHEQIIRERDGEQAGSGDEVAAFYMPRANYFLGKYLRYGGAYPDGVIRLVKRGKARFACLSVHEQIKIDGAVRWLENDLLHMADPTFRRYLERSNRYTSLQAEAWIKQEQELKKSNQQNKTGVVSAPSSMIGDLPQRGVWGILSWMVLRPLWTMGNIYLRHRGYADGYVGFVWAYCSGLHLALSYVKWREESDLRSKTVKPSM